MEEPMNQEEAAPVLFEERTAANGHRIGMATLNSPRTLNGFSLPMAQLLDEQLQAWANDDGIVLVVLQGAGEKAFCAGGDLHSLHRSMREQAAGGEADIQKNHYASTFFEVEYRVDHRIHTFPKPVLCWGHGIVMGGGIGLMSGASHRVVSERSKLAFPEISVGLFPDVGGSWLLRRAPGQSGRFLALTGALLGPADAIHAGLADLQLPEAAREQVLQALLEQPWAAPEQNHTLVSELLQAFAVAPQPGPLQTHAALVDTLCSGDDLEIIAERILALQTDDPWLASAQKTLAAGAPGSARLAFELLRKAETLSLAEVYRLEFIVALHCCAHGDFAEGIRALLIDKDRSPRWQPGTLAEADNDWSRAFFHNPWPQGQHPLADLGRDDTARN
jgi:enoyl-CoA hydratase/carnithine racemase